MTVIFRTVRDCLVACLSVYALLVAGALSADDQPITPKETIRLFNGKDLAHFETWLGAHGHEDPDRVYGVVDAIDGAPAIRISGNGYGGLITKESYTDYRLTVEYKWGQITWGHRKERSRDSGILLHCQGEPGNLAKNFKSPWMQSIEFQIIEGGVGDILILAGWDKSGNKLPTSIRARTTKDRDGEVVFCAEAELQTHVARSGARRINWWGRDPDWKDTLGVRGALDPDTHNGWTKLEAVCRGGDLRYYVNGTLVIEGSGSNLTHGRLLFQSEGAEIFFRRIDLGPLKK